MNCRTVISILVAAMLALTSAQALAGQGKGGGGSANRPQQIDQDGTHDRVGMQDRDRIRVPDQDKDQDRDQDRQRVHVQDPMSMSDAEIYGGELMTAEERNQYRKQLKVANTAKKREQYQLQHESKMQQRALEKGQDLVPPGQGPVYGGELMTVQERNEYREQLRQLDSDQQREKFVARHREKMQQRAKAVKIKVSEAK